MNEFKNGWGVAVCASALGLLASPALAQRDLGGPSTSRGGAEVLLEQSDALTARDERLGNGTYADRYEVEVDAGDTITVDLTSEDFDTYLGAFLPGGDDAQDDDGGDGVNSRLQLEIQQAGTLEVVVTSYAENTTGGYDLVVTRGDADAVGEPPNGVRPPGNVTVDELTRNQPTAMYRLQLERGERVNVAVESDDFDTTLTILDPEGTRYFNDDVGESLNSAFTIDPAVEGQYLVQVAPYGGDGTGEFVLSTNVDGASFERVEEVNGRARTQRGELTDDATERVYEIEVADAGAVQIDLSSSDFDTLVRVTSPDGTRMRNDDGGEGLNSRVVMLATPGVYEVTAGSYRSEGVGDFRLDVVGAASVQPLRLGPAEQELGELSRRNPVANHELRLDEGETVVIGVESEDFDPMVMVIGPDDEEIARDDDGGVGLNSRLRLTAPEAGQYLVQVMSYNRGATGEYTLSVQRRGGEGAADRPRNLERQLGRDPAERPADAAPTPTPGGERDLRPAADEPDADEADDDDADELREDGFRGRFRERGSRLAEPAAEARASADAGVELPQTHTITAEVPNGAPRLSLQDGELDDKDAADDAGRYVDWYEIDATAGQRVRLSAVTDAFDSMLLLVSPSGQERVADDFAGQVGHSVIAATLDEAGRWRVGVTSYDSGESGAYWLIMDLDRTVDHAQHADALGQPMQPSTDAVEGTLTGADRPQDSGRLTDLYTFEGRAGQRAYLEMTSKPLDTFLLLIGPDGQMTSNDDFRSSLDRSRIELNLPATGEYTVVATSYAPDEQGLYDLVVSLDQQPEGDGWIGQPEDRQVYGLFVGLADYPNSPGDLPRCDTDASNLHQAFIDFAGMTRDNSVLLTNNQATPAAITGAVARLAERMDEDDVFVMFYSGHGNRVERGEPDAADPDGMDETLAVWGGAVTDDQLATALDAVPAAISLVMLDACYSGGFAKDIVDRPGRIGLFSSEEDALSLVAGQLKAGGYLSRFVLDALRPDGEGSDANGDLNITAFELCTYIARRAHAGLGAARTDLLAGQMINEIETHIDPSQDLAYQRLVIDRGGVSPHTVLLQLPGPAADASADTMARD